MKSARFYTSLICLMVGLTACPYKETYQTVSFEPTVINGLQVYPATLFYHTDKKISSCDVGFYIKNPTDSAKRVQLGASVLTNLKSRVVVEKIYGVGISFPSNTVFEIPSKSEKMLALSFQDSSKFFGDTINVEFNVQGIRYGEFVYKRIRR